METKMSKLSNGLIGLLLSLVFFVTSSFAEDAVSANKATKAGLYLTAAESGEMLKDPDVILIDVRSRAEVAFLGIPKRTNVNIPYMTMPMVAEYDSEDQGYLLEINPDFPMVFQKFISAKELSADSKFILMCRSGTRSARAADLLYDMGYKNVYTIIDGFEGDKVAEGPLKGQRMKNGWKNAGLEWTYKISPDQVYPDDI